MSASEMPDLGPLDALVSVAASFAFFAGLAALVIVCRFALKQWRGISNHRAG